MRGKDEAAPAAVTASASCLASSVCKPKRLLLLLCHTVREGNWLEQPGQRSYEPMSRSNRTATTSVAASEEARQWPL